LIFVVFFLLPGVTYQFLRERWRGPVPGEQNLAERVLRAVTASIALSTVYAIAIGPELVTLARGKGGWMSGLATHPREAGLWGLVLFLGIPAAAAAAVSWLERRRTRSLYRPIPTAWDYMLSRATSSRFVRARLKDGTWIGGWYGSRSYSSGYPNYPDIYLQWAYEMNADGSFGAPIERTAGVYLRLDNIDVLELVDHADAVGPDGEEHPDEQSRPGVERRSLA
jgi:Family of unknown function (DUF6338)